MFDVKTMFLFVIVVVVVLISLIDNSELCMPGFSVWLDLYNLYIKPRSHLTDMKAELSRPWWSGNVLWSRREVGKEWGWVLERPERSMNLVEVSPTVCDCFELFKTFGVVGNEEQSWIKR